MTERQHDALPWARIAALTTGVLVSGAALAWAVAQGSDATVDAGVNPAPAQVADADRDDDPTVLDDDGRFTGPGEVWPPQPKDATDVVARSFGDLEPEPMDERLAALDADAPAAQAPSEVVADDAAAQAALGDNVNLIAVERSADGAQLIYYSLSNNQTVDIAVADGAVASLDTYSPGDFQPELSVDEKNAAIDLARVHWQGRGDSRIDSLQGFGILAFQPGGDYYDTRMVYVSFHVDEDARPELLTWVDLAAGQIIKSEVDR